MSDIQTIEITRAHAEKQLALVKSLTKLQSNRDFKLAIEEGYFDKEAQRLINLLTDETLNERAIEDVRNSLTGISYFKRWIRLQYQFAEHFEKAIMDCDLALTELREEDTEL